MKLKMNPKKVIQTRLGIQPKGPVHAFFTATCALHMDKYVPFREGNLAGTVVSNGNVTNNVTVDTITYEQKYARYVFYGLSKTGKQLNYTHTYHDLAGPHWDKQMWSAEKDKVISEVEKQMKRGSKK